MSFLNTLFAKLSGWKTLLGYLIAQFAGSYPMLFDAFVAWKSNPGDVQAIMNLIAQLAMAGGLFHVFIKNLKKMAKGQLTA
jgi:hypothetical protein